MAAKALLKTFMRPRDADAIRADIAAIDAAEAARAQAAVEAAARRQELVIEGDVAALEAHDGRVRRLGMESEVATAKRARLVEELETARAADEQARRRALYEKGLRASRAAAKLRTEDYARLAAQIAAVLEQIESHREAIRTANAALPDGAAPVFDPEAAMHEPPRPPVPIKSRRRTFRDGPNGVVEEVWQEHEFTLDHGHNGVPRPALAEAVMLPGTSYRAVPFWPQLAK
ncbi:hypothetical protein [Methylobacterium sp. WSM2598]|uniref:hypothetical protein n=1 Tax=Methylobacterium sp. WSM2598 TaxID=398261 RepID=UPI000475BDB4|nr:hypothetical protein [Methylobacterium sp. WSM2598]